jgi:arginyl-tRNA synthetase
MEQLNILVADSIKQLFDIDVDVVFSQTDERFGDFATNVALQIAKQVGKSPREIAEAIAESITGEIITKVDVAGPGFINITLSDTALYSFTKLDVKKPLSDKSVVIETNNPNPFKSMHIGHAFNAIIADTLANLIEVAGANTYRVSYHGDVGLHVGKSMYSLLNYVAGHPEKLDDIPVEERNTFMSKMYAEGSTAYKNSPQAKEDIEELTKQSFTREDPVYALVYEKCKTWSFEQIDRDVIRLGNKPTEKRFLESDAEVRGIKIVHDNTPGVFKQSQGAIIFEGSKYGSFDNAFISARGTGLYASRDLGLMQLKDEYYHPYRSYIVTAEEQRDYFKGVIMASELCNPTSKGVTVNIPTGTVKLPTGKMSSRDGDVVDIAWLFDEVAKAITARGGKPDDQSVAAVLRYQFLQVRIGGDVVFDIKEAVSVTGNSGPYLQYAHARARSILAKVDEVQDKPLQDLQSDERSLLRKISHFNEVVNKSVNEMLPHHICNYLYELSQAFNRFYEKNRVINDDRQGIRLKLVLLYADTIKSGLELLGIHAPDKM